MTDLCAHEFRTLVYYGAMFYWHCADCGKLLFVASRSEYTEDESASARKVYEKTRQQEQESGKWKR